MSVTLTDQDKLTLRTAAYGAVSLMAAAGAAPVSLSPAAGLVADVLAEQPRDARPDGASLAGTADHVLPALTAAMSLLRKAAPAEADTFRSAVVAAVEAAARTRPDEPGPAVDETVRKIVAALDAAGQDRPDLQQAIQDMVDAGFVGVQLRVHDRGEEWVGSAGVRKLGDLGKPPTNGQFRIGSNTKTFTAALVLRLVVEGTLALDAPVADHLTEFGLDRQITVRMLLQHTSGVFNFTGEYYEDGTVVPGIPWQGREWVDNRFKDYRPQELVKLALSKPARFAPGTDWGYSNTNYVLARLLVEKATGRSVAEEMQRLILRPLGLADTVVPTTEPDIAEPYAHAYYRYEEDGRQKTVDVTRQNPSWISSGGDMISTTRDLHTFISSLLGGRLLPAPLLAEMCTPHPKAGYGLGVFVQDIGSDGVTVITHNGSLSGNAALMYSTPDGTKTLTASLTYVDDAARSMAAAFQTTTQKLLEEVFDGA
ncbi:serine hydrolase domain-containing protein [Streptomyces sp. NPDC058892]|uniref:serine hydrolase domain-containing protein n=1 Tax=unclassified Streptomyces TaxID=2593676 RepID=UPI0036CF70F5